MNPAEWTAVLLLIWCVLSVPVGVGAGKFLARRRPAHYMTRATRARSRIDLRRDQ